MTTFATDISEEDRHKILITWNQTYSNYNPNKNLIALFEEQAERNPDNIALKYQQQEMSYQELNLKVNKLAHYLRSLRVEKNTLIAIEIEPSLDLIISILGILKAGGAYLPLDPNNPSERNEFIIKDSQTKLLLTQSTILSKYKNNNLSIFCLDTLSAQLADQPFTNPVPINHRDDLAYVIYTSGSTGKPKGVMITHQNIAHYIHWLGETLSISDADVIDFSSSIAFDFAVTCSLFPLAKGAKIAICSDKNKQDPFLYLKHLVENNVSIIKITPSHFRQFKETVYTENKNLDLKYIIFGGEILFKNDIQDWIEKFPAQIAFNEYGPTETTVGTSTIKIDKNNIHHFSSIIPIGKPVSNTQLYILNDDLNPVNIDVTGELYIGGEGVAKGYLNHPELTKSKFIKNPFDNTKHSIIYKTGDLCRYLPDGNIEFIGRADDQVKIRGFRVELTEVENHLMTHPGIKNAAVICRSDQMGENQLIAYYIPREPIQLSHLELRHSLREHLPEYMMPSLFISVVAFPLSASGKLNRKKLAEIETISVDEAPLPKTPLESALKLIWSSVLNQEVNIHDNFFDIGGNSLTAARIITQIKKLTKKSIPLLDFYRAANIAELALTIDQLDEAEDHPNDDHKLISKNIPLSELQYLFWLMRLFYPKSKVLNLVNRQRVGTKIDVNGIKYALRALCKKHIVLCYDIATYSPLQHYQQIQEFPIENIDIQHLSTQEQESELTRSLSNLEIHGWESKHPLILVKLFSLDHDLSEIQLAISHFVCDEISVDIILKDFNEYYTTYKNNTMPSPDTAHLQYEEYIYQEQKIVSKNLNRDIAYWTSYLKDASSVIFPKKYIDKNSDYSSTSYFEIQNLTLNNLLVICKKNRITIADSLCAAVSIALAPYLDGVDKVAVINFIKSIRENPDYDNTVGLFVQTDLIKVDLSNTKNLLDLSKKIQISRTESSPYQSCPVIVKLACLLEKYWRSKKICNFIIDQFTTLYISLFPQHQLNKKILSMFCRVFIAWKKQHHFVDINILNNFSLETKNNTLFGLPLKETPPYQGNKMVEKNILNIWFERDSQNRPFLIISGNLKPEFRAKLAEDILRIISNIEATATMNLKNDEIL